VPRAATGESSLGHVAGFTAPEGKAMGDAGAIVSGSAGTAQAKQDALEAAGVKVGKTPARPPRSRGRSSKRLAELASGDPGRSLGRSCGGK
jgi:succinyl-CoA synthetase alpha subunit